MRSNKTWKYYLLAALALIGMVISGILTRHFYELRSGLAAFKSACNISSAMNCDVVASSRYAELFMGIPLSSLAAGWFLSVMLVSFFGQNTFWKRETDRALLALGLGGILFSLSYIGVMAFALRTYCLYCLITDALVFSIFALALSLRPDGFKAHRPDLAKWKVFGGLGAASIVVALIGMSLLNPFSVNRSMASELVQGVLSTPPVEVGSGPEVINPGRPDAPVTIEEFLDFQCPSCRLGAHTITTVINRYQNEVRVVLRNYPLDPKCNPGGGMHTTSCESARVAYCVNRQGKLLDVYHALFDAQDGIEQGKPTEIARKLPGIDEGRLLGCLQSEDTRAAIAADIQKGDELGIRSTPTFFINGRKVEGAYPAQIWFSVIDQLIAAKQTQG